MSVDEESGDDSLGHIWPPAGEHLDRDQAFTDWIVRKRQEQPRHSTRISSCAKPDFSSGGGYATSAQSGVPDAPGLRRSPCIRVEAIQLERDDSDRRHQSFSHRDADQSPAARSVRRCRRTPTIAAACDCNSARPLGEDMASQSGMKARDDSARPLKIASRIQGSSASLAAILPSASSAAGSSEQRLPARRSPHEANSDGRIAASLMSVDVEKSLARERLAATRRACSRVPGEDRRKIWIRIASSTRSTAGKRPQCVQPRQGIACWP